MPVSLSFARAVVIKGVPINMKRLLCQVMRFLVAALLVLVVGMWMRSYRAMDALHWSDGRRIVSLMSSAGRLNLTESVWLGRTAGPSDWRLSSTSRADASRLPLWETDPNIYGRRRFLGFEWSNDLSPWPSNQKVVALFFLPTYRLIAVPYWSLAVLFALPLVHWAWQAYRRAARLRRGLCPSCGYDLRGTPGRCPECGWKALGHEQRLDAHIVNYADDFVICYPLLLSDADGQAGLAVLVSRT